MKEPEQISNRMSGWRAFAVAGAISIALSMTMAAVFAVTPVRYGLPGAYSWTAARRAAGPGVREVGQSFISTAPGLYRVEFLVNEEPPSPLVFHLREAPSGRNLVTRVVQPRRAEHAEFIEVPVMFPPIEDSAGKRYYFFVDSGRQDRPGGLPVIVSLVDAYASGVRLNGHERRNSDIIFKTYHEASPLAAAAALWARLPLEKPRIYGRWFFGLALVAYFLGLGYAICRFGSPELWRTR